MSATGLFLPTLLTMMPLYSTLLTSDESNADMDAQLMAGSLVLTGIAIIIVIIVSMLTQAGLMKSSLIITNGGTPDTPDLFMDVNTYLKGFAAMLLCALMTVVGTCLCILPGLVLAFFIGFVPYEILGNPNVDVIEAIKNSFRITRSDWTTALILSILGAIIVTIGSYTAIGIIPCNPFYYLLNAVTYRTLKANMDYNSAMPQYNEPAPPPYNG